MLTCMSSCQCQDLPWRHGPTCGLHYVDGRRSRHAVSMGRSGTTEQRLAYRARIILGRGGRLGVGDRGAAGAAPRHGEQVRWKRGRRDNHWITLSCLWGRRFPRQVQRQVLGRLPVNLLETPQPFDVVVTDLHTRDRLAVEVVESGEQGDRAVAPVIVGPGADLAHARGNPGRSAPRPGIGSSRHSTAPARARGDPGRARCRLESIAAERQELERRWRARFDRARPSASGSPVDRSMWPASTGVARPDCWRSPRTWRGSPAPCCACCASPNWAPPAAAGRRASRWDRIAAEQEKVYEEVAAPRATE